MFYDIILRLNPIALLAQLDRVSGYGPEGQGFESLTARHKKTRLHESVTLFFLYGEITKVLVKLLQKLAGCGAEPCK